MLVSYLLSFQFHQAIYGWILDSKAFHRVQEHPKQSSDEDIMTIRSWRLPMNSDYEQNQKGVLFFMIYRNNMGYNFIKLYRDGF